MSERHHPTMSETMTRVVDQTEQKKLWKDHDSPELMVSMMKEEVVELEEAIQDSLLSGDVFNVASEIGDILYLSLKLCHILGFVPEDVVDMKIVRNDLKYPNDMNSYGDYASRRQQSKDMWTAMGGDVAFSHAYLDVLSKDEDTPPEISFADALAYTNGNGHSNGHHKEDVTKLPVLVYANNGDKH